MSANGSPMSKTVLAVDDSKTMREMVSFTLKDAGFNVLEAEDGRAALTVLEQTLIDVIITDLNMPNMDGIELIKAVRANVKHKFAPILMLTTESDPTKKQSGREAGATGWIVKPFSPDKLVEVVRKVCA